MSGISSNLVFETLEDLRLVVSYQTTANPTDAEWDAWLTATTALWKKTSEFRLLVVTEGGHPNKSQVERVGETKRQQERTGARKLSEPRTAIISGSGVLRFIASIMMFLNPRIRCYSPSQRDEAYAHIGLTPAQRGVAERAVERLRAKLAAHSASPEIVRAR